MRINLKVPLLLFLLWSGNQNFLFSQSSDFIAGRVINSATSKPVPFATIKLKNNQLGVYANADGDFRISRNIDFHEDSLLVTCIGYKISSVAFRNLSENSLNKILLTPTVYGLREVKVVASRKKLNSLAIIRRAIRKIADNYPDKPFNFISYYRDYQKRDGNYINLNEAIVQTLDNGFTIKPESNRYRLLDFKKNMDFPRMDISSYYDGLESQELNTPNKMIPQAFLGDQYGNELFVLMGHDAIRGFNERSFSFIETLSTDFIENHAFSDPVTVLNNNLMLYKIEFTGKSWVTGVNLKASGAIYIQPKDYSIHKLEYSCNYTNIEKPLNQMFNIDVEYGYENTVDSRMCLKYISFNNFFKVVDKNDSTYFRVLSSYLDTHTNIKPTVILYLNNKVDPVTASKKVNYEIKIGKKAVKVNSIQVVGKTIYVRIKEEDIKGRHDSCKVVVRNVKDTDGNMVGKRKSVDLYQYRELFVQEYNKSLPLKDSCDMEYLPLEKNCISKFSGKDKYWMNTPENIKSTTK
jgi:hypothetical protein